MKLKSLKIHNIASIEDAVIDFDGSVLGSQELFLICGPTGSGKTTILDAICLALFKKTPRMENGPSNELIDTLDGTKKVAVNQVRNVLHLVRKNAVDASVTLTFEVDGHEYIAFWQAYRNNQFRNGKETSTFAALPLAEKLARELNTEWTLTDDEGHVYIKDVEKEIRRVIKMDFNQFCKTTLLAQGDFTKFLSSTANEKADILEKLVGSKQYAEVGRIINQTANAKFAEIDLLEKELKNFEILTDEQRSDKEAEIKRLDEQKADFDKQKAEVDAKIRRINEHAKAVADEAKAKANLEAAELRQQGDDYKSAVQTVSLWDATTDVRAALATLNQCAATEAANSASEESQSRKFEAGLAGLRCLTDRRIALETSNETLKSQIAGREAFKDMFANVGEICSKNKSIEDNRKLIEESASAIETADARLKSLEEQKVEKESLKQAALADIDKLEKENSNLEAQARDAGADTIESESKSLNDSVLALNNAKNSLNQLTDAKTDLDTKKEAESNAEAELKKLSDAKSDAADKVLTTARTAEKSKARYDKMYVSLDDHAKALRAKLSVGDVCPVCGTSIEKLLDESELRAQLAPLEEEYKADQAAYEKATKALAQVNANEAATSKALDKARKETSLASKKVIACTESLNALIATLGIKGLEELDSKEEELKQLTLDIETRSYKIRELRGQIDANNKKISDIRANRIDAAEKFLRKISTEITNCSVSKSQIEGQVNKANTDITNAQATIKSLVNPDWQPTQPDRYFEELKSAADAYNADVNLLNDNLSAIKTLTDCIVHIELHRATAVAAFPQWAACEVAEAKELPNVVAAWAGIASDARLLATAIAQNAERKQVATATVNYFDTANPDVDMAQVERLLSVGNAEIQAMRNLLDETNAAKSAAKALYDEAAKRLAEFAESPVDETESTESLEEKTEQLANESAKCAETKGRLSSELQFDSENRSKRGKKQQDLDEKRADYADWETLNRYLGSTDGKNFRMVAQSFILSELLDRANEYLGNISDRYSLFCKDGSLTIMVRDAYQGNIERTTSTLSGGESFIISLSLALGLSSMQNVDFEVDTLFIDEGFGTLSPEFLDPVIYALKRLNATYGRRVGIISHVDSLKQRIPATIDVSRHGNSSSRITLSLNS